MCLHAADSINGRYTTRCVRSIVNTGLPPAQVPLRAPSCLAPEAILDAVEAICEPLLRGLDHLGHLARSCFDYPLDEVWLIRASSRRYCRLLALRAFCCSPTSHASPRLADHPTTSSNPTFETTWFQETQNPEVRAEVRAKYVVHVDMIPELCPQGLGKVLEKVGRETACRGGN